MVLLILLMNSILPSNLAGYPPEPILHPESNTLLPVVTKWMLKLHASHPQRGKEKRIPLYSLYQKGTFPPRKSRDSLIFRWPGFFVCPPLSQSAATIKGLSCFTLWTKACCQSVGKEPFHATGCTAVGTGDIKNVRSAPVHACHHSSAFSLVSSTLFSLFSLLGWDIFCGIFFSQGGAQVADTFIVSYLNYLDKKLNFV